MATSRTARLRPALLALALAPLALAGPAAQAQTGGKPPEKRTKVALTFDDLPVHMPLPPGTTRLDVARSILASLKTVKAPPTYGFINAKTADSPDTVEFLRLWRAAGHPLANHTFSHLDFDTNTVAAFQADVEANEAVLRELMGTGDWHWLRYPYLREGNTLEKRNAVRTYLKGQGYRIAQVTLDFWDWAFNEPYARCATRNDRDAIASLEAAYMAEAERSLAWGREAATRLYAREINHVMLLHVGAFQNVMLPRLLELLGKQGFDLVTLEEAQSDPVYATDPGRARNGGATLLHQMLDANGLPLPSRSDDPFPKIAALCR